MKKAALLLSSAAVLCLSVSSAWAQDTAAGQSGARAGSGYSDGDIIVTARRREESLSKVPVAVTALSSEALIEQGVRSELDLQSAVPGFLARQVGTSNVLSFSIRGQSIDGYSSSPPAVLAYINEFQIAAPGASTFFDLEGVEVLKGPQGTLFGRNTTGGAVLYRTKMPGDEMEGFISGRYGNFDEVQIQAGVTIPIAPGIASIRIAGNFSDGGGYVKNLGYYQNTAFAGGAPSEVTFVPKNDTLGDVRNKSIRGTLLLTPSDSFRNTTMVQYSADDGTQIPGFIYSQYGQLGAQSAFEFLNITTGPFQGMGGLSQNIAWQRKTNRKTYSELSNDYRARTMLATNTTELDLSDTLTLKNIVGWYKAEKNAVIDLDGSSFNLYGNTEFFTPPFLGVGDTTRGGQHIADWIFSNELQLQGTAFDGKLEFTIGAFYANARRLDDASLQFFGGTIPPYNFKTRDRSYAGFVQATYNITDEFHLTGGFRYSKDKIRGAQQFPSAFGPELAPILYPQIADSFETVQNISFKNPSWTISLDYQVTPDLLIYVTQRGSWRAGGLNFPVLPRTLDGTGVDANGNVVTDGNGNVLYGNVFKPEKARDIEVGAKFNGRLGNMPFTLSANFYNQWIKDIQRSAFIPFPTGPALVTLNVPKVQITGQELAISMRPAEWLSLGGQLSHINPRFTNPDTFAIGTPRHAGPYGDVPEWSGSAFVEFRMEMADQSSVSLRGDVYAQSKLEFKNYTPADTGDTTIPGYALVNARLSWNNLMGTGLTAALYGKNIFDKQWYAGGIPTETAFGVNVASPGRPRQYGVELRFDF